MIVATALVLAMAASDGLLVMDGQGIAMSERGRWTSMDGDDKSITQGRVDRLTRSGGYAIQAGKVRAIRGRVTPVEENIRTWELSPAGGELEIPYAVWFGAQPIPPKVTRLSPSSATYVDAAKAFLRTKGILNPKPVLSSVVRTDLDGDGTDEVIVTAASHPLANMRQMLAPNSTEPKGTAAYSAIFIRYVSGRGVRTATVAFNASKASDTGLTSYETVAGLWNLDAKRGVEILVSSPSFEGHGYEVLNFKAGKVISLASAANGV